MTKMSEGAVLPVRAHDGDAGLDLHACEAAHIGPGERWSVGTGIGVEIPAGHAGLVLPRSGLAREHGISLVNSPGLIDSGYRGEIRVLMLNTDPANIFTVKRGDRIAQLPGRDLPGRRRGPHRPAGHRPDRDCRAGRDGVPRRLRSRQRRLRLQRPLAQLTPAAVRALSCAAASKASSSGSRLGLVP